MVLDNDLTQAYRALAKQDYDQAIQQYEKALSLAKPVSEHLCTLLEILIRHSAILAYVTRR